MTTILLYEFITAGGLYADSADVPPTGSLLREGLAMLHAVHRGLRQWPGLNPLILWDARLATDLAPPGPRRVVANQADHDRQFTALLTASDEALLIAPEFSQHLSRRCREAAASHVRLLSPDPDFVDLTSDKCATLHRLAEADVPVPITYRCESARDLPDQLLGDWVVKPNDGAGSNRLQRVSADRVSRCLGPDEIWCVQAYCAGRPASVAALCHGTSFRLLPPCWQELDADNWTYRGGSMIEQPDSISRAQRLASLALRGLPGTSGYVGIDLVLGQTASADRVIEVNPRITTSFVGLSEAARGNLAAGMRDWALGNQVELSFAPPPFRFSVEG